MWTTRSPSEPTVSCLVGIVAQEICKSITASIRNMSNGTMCAIRAAHSPFEETGYSSSRVPRSQLLNADGAECSHGCLEFEYRSVDML